MNTHIFPTTFLRKYICFSQRPVSNTEILSLVLMNNFSAEYLLILVEEYGTGSVGWHMNNGYMNNFSAEYLLIFVKENSAGAIGWLMNNE